MVNEELEAEQNGSEHPESAEETTQENQLDQPTDVTDQPAVEEEVVVESEPIVEPVTAEATVPSSSEDDDEDSDDSDEEDEDEEDGDDDSTSVDYHTLSKEQLVEAARATATKTAREAIKHLREIRSILNEVLRAEQRQLLQEHIDSGNEVEEFKFDDGGMRNQVKMLFEQAKLARQEERERIEKEKLQNLKLKQGILDKLKEITESDETEKSLEDVKALQQEWRGIRVVPQEHSQNLWETYHFYLDKFYDNHSINIELKELDRKKNLETKIELCKKVDELSAETSLKKSFILLNKYQEEFRNTGPVPREYNKEIWERFQKATDAVYAQKKEQFNELEEKRKKNLELKEVLVEKASLIAAENYKKTKDWSLKTKELDDLMTEWKTIGQVPKSKSDSIWKSFREQFKEFYNNKNLYFKDQHKARKANQILKEDICKRAEELQDSTDFSFATNELIKLQKEWKDIGPVPDKISNAIWKRFRSACDHFFARKQNEFASKRDEENQNLQLKEDLIQQLNSILEKDSQDNLLDTLKGIQRDWKAIGYVPIKKKKEIENRYQKASNKVFEKFKLNRQELKAGQVKEHYKHLAELPSGGKRLSEEEDKIKRKISYLRGEIQTLENNMEFFGRSAGAQKLKAEIEGKIDKTKEQIDRLKSELKAIRDLKTKPADAKEQAAS